MADDLIALAGDLAFEKKRLTESLRRLEGILLTPEAGVHNELDLLARAVDRLGVLTKNLVTQVNHGKMESTEALLAGACHVVEQTGKRLERPLSVERKSNNVLIERDTLAKFNPILADMLATFVEFCIESSKERAARTKRSKAYVQIEIKPVEEGYRLTVVCDGNGLVPPRADDHGRQLADLGVRAHFEGKAGHWSAWIFLLPASRGAFRALPVQVGERKLCIPSWAVASAHPIGEQGPAQAWALAPSLERFRVDLSGTGKPDTRYGEHLVEVSAGTHSLTYVVNQIFQPDQVFMKPLPAALNGGGRFLGVVLTENSDNQLSIVLDPAYLVYGPIREGGPRAL